MSGDFIEVLKNNHVQCPECGHIHIAFEKECLPSSCHEELSRCECGTSYKKMKSIPKMKPGSVKYTIKTILKKSN